MYSEIAKKNRNDILKFLQSLGQDRRIYSAHRQGLEPLLPDMEAYIYATEEEIVVVLMDHQRFAIHHPRRAERRYGLSH